MSGAPFRIEFERSGGFAGITLQTVVDSAQLDPAEVAELEQLLAAVEVTPGAPGGPDRFQYDLKIVRGDQTEDVTLRDGSLTDEQRRLVDMLTELASPSS